MSIQSDHPRFSKRVTSTRRWQVLRQIVLERDDWACAYCATRRGRLEIDHVKPVRTHPELSYDPNNLQVLCPSCHTRKTRIECGHPAPIRSPERTAWANAVADLATKPNRH